MNGCRGRAIRAVRRSGRVGWGRLLILLLILLATAASHARQAIPQPPQTTPSTSRSGGNLNFAHQLLRDRRYDLAVAEYESYLATTPAPPAAAAVEARYGLATAYLFLGRYAEARAAFEQFLSDAPEHPNAATARFRVGETAYMLGDLPAAREALERYTREFPAHHHAPNAWQYLGDACLRLDDLPAARAAYEHALEGNSPAPTADRARYGLARALAAEGELDAAIARLEELRDTGGNAWRERALYELGTVQLRAGRPAEALAALEALEAAAVPGAGSLRNEARLKRAEALEQLDRLDDAASVLEPLTTEANGLSLRAAYQLAGLRLRQQRPADALAVVDEALARMPDSPMTPLLLFRSADAAAAAGQPDDAGQRYLRLVRDYPGDAWADDALLAAAGLAARGDNPASARDLALRLLTEYPASPLGPDARLLAGQIDITTDPDAAITRLEPLLTDAAARPEVVQAARLALGVAYRKKGQADRAAEVLQPLAATPDATNGNNDDTDPAAGPPAAAPAAGTAEAQYVIGVGHFDAGRFAECIPPLTAYLDQRPDGDVVPDALAMLAIARQETGDEPGSTSALDRLASDFASSPVAAPTFLRLGESALEDRQFDRAAELLARAVATASEPGLKARARWNLGWARLEGQQPAEAVESFRAILTDTPDDPLAAEASLALGRALAEAGRTDEALQTYETIRTTNADAASLPGDADESARAAAVPAARAELAEARLLDRLGQAELAAGPDTAEAGREKLRRAADRYEAYLARQLPAGAGSNLETSDLVLADLGWARLDSGDPAAAEKAFERILAEFPGSPRGADARLVLADLAYARGEHDRVETLLAPLVASDSKAEAAMVHSALFRLGLSRIDRQQWSEARDAFGRIIAASDSAAAASDLALKARFWEAEAAFQAGEAATAETAFRALVGELADRPSNAAPEWVPTARLRLVESLVALQRYDEALTEAEALQREVLDFVARHELDYARGRALAGLARFDEAREAYQATIDAQRDDDFGARAQFMRGETFFHQEKYPEALREYLRVDFAYPDQPTWRAAALLEAGKVAERMNRPADAISFYEKLLDQFPTDAHAEEARTRLKAARESSTPPAS